MAVYYELADTHLKVYQLSHQRNSHSDLSNKGCLICLFPQDKAKLINHVYLYFRKFRLDNKGDWYSREGTVETFHFLISRLTYSLFEENTSAWSQE